MWWVVLEVHVDVHEGVGYVVGGCNVFAVLSMADMVGSACMQKLWSASWVCMVCMVHIWSV